MDEKTLQSQMAPKLVLEKEVQHSSSEITQEFIDALIIAAHARVLSGETAAQVFEIFRETMHWAFAKQGTHSTPGDLLAVTLAMHSDTGSTDATPKDGNKIKFDA